MKRAFVCKNGRSSEISFPDEFVSEVKRGARMGPCEHL
jgi:non-canonical (house-cleaning) NTP pyrophosphatase